MEVNVTPKTLLKFLKRDLETNKYSVYIWGPPGVGKTECVFQAAQELSLPVRVLSISLEHPYTLGGFPVPLWREQRMDKFPPKVIKELREGVLFLDDFAAAEPQQQRMSLTLTTYRSVGDYSLPTDVRIVFASNRLSDLSYIVKPSFAVLNRCKHYVLYPSFLDWTEWLQKVSVPLEEFSNEDWMTSVPSETATIISSFLKFFPQHFFSEPSKLDVMEAIAFPTPRSWTNFARDFGNYIKSEGYPKTPVHEILRKTDEISVLVSSWVGSQPLADFIQYLSVDPSTLEKAILDWDEIRKLPINEQSLYAYLVYLSIDEKERDEFISFVGEKLEKEAVSVLSFFFRKDERVPGKHKVRTAASSFQFAQRGGERR